MNANARNKVALLLLLLMAAACQAENAGQTVRRGNELYARKDWHGAIKAYEKAIGQEPAEVVPKFNRANALFKAGDFAAATDAYRQVAAESREIKLVAKAKYNLGNCFFEEGMRQSDSDLKKSIEAMQEAIQNWRAALEIDPENENALKNIEAAKLMIKNIMDEQKKRQEQQGQDPNSTQQQGQDPNSTQQQGDQGRQQQQQKQGQDPNDPNQPGQQQQQGEQQEKRDEKKEEQKAGENQEQEAYEKKEAPDATAEDILRDEQDRKKQLQPGQQPGYMPVEQDW